MPRPKTAPNRVIVGNIEYFSVAAAAEALGRTVRTLKRLEVQGVIPRAEHVLPGHAPGTRWYTKADLALLRRVAAETGFDRPGKGRAKKLLEGLAAELRQRYEDGHVEDKVTRPWTDLGGVSEDAVPRRVRRWGDIEGGDDVEEKIEPSLCPCGKELLWRTERNPNGQGQQIPWCEDCGVMDFREPDPVDPNRCECGRELVWQMGDPHQGFQPTCPKHGLVQVPMAEPMRQAGRPGNTMPCSRPWVR